MEFAYLACLLFCYLPILTVTGQEEGGIQFEIRIVPSDIPVLAADLNSNKMLTCEGVHSGAPGDQQPTLTWYFEGTEVTQTIPSPGSRMRVEREPNKVKLVLQGIQDEDGGDYKCVGTLAGQTDEKTIRIEIFEAPKMMSPQEQVGLLGTDGKLECVVTGKPTPRVFWKFLNMTTITGDDKYVIENSNLIIKSLTLEDTKVYICSIEVPARGSVIFKNIAYTVAKKPEIDAVLGIQPINPKVGDEVKLTCRAEGVPKPKISYKKESNLVDDSMVSDGVLTIPSLKQEDEANYICFATNVGGSANKSTYLDVKIPPKVEITDLTPSPDGGDPVEGQLVSIKCEAKGDPKPDIKWKKESMATYYEDGIQGDGGPRFESDGGTDREDSEIKTVSKTMVFDSIRHQDAGTYTCLVINVVGEVTSETTISIRYPPDFNTDFTQRTFYGWKGHTANLTCQSTANPTPIYRWYTSKEGDGGVQEPDQEILPDDVFTISERQAWNEYKLSSSSLLIDMSLRQDVYGTYFCEASNDLAEGRKTLAVVLEEAVPPGSPEVKLGKILTTMVTLKFSPPAQDGNQPVQGYHYEYYPDGDMASKQTGSVDMDGAETSVDIRHLKFATKYVVQVKAKNNVGAGQAISMTFTTKERSTPLRLVLSSNKEGESANSYTIRWEEPEDGEDPITEFIVKYTKVEVTVGADNDWDMERVLGQEKEEIFKGSGHQQFQLNNLEKDTFYQVQVTARNGVGESEPAVMLIKTSKGTPGVDDEGNEEEKVDDAADKEEIVEDTSDSVNVSRSASEDRDGASADSAGTSSGLVIGIILVILVLIFVVVIAIYLITKKKPELVGRLRGRLGGKGGEEERGAKDDGKDQAEEEKLIKKEDTVKVENETEGKPDEVVEEKPEEFDPDTKPSAQPVVADTDAGKDVTSPTEIKVTPETPEKPENPTA